MNKIIFLDTETGGLLPGRHALLQVAARANWAPLHPLCVWMLPQEGRIVDARAAVVNGYSLKQWRDVGAVPFDEGMMRVRGWLAEKLDREPRALVVAHNAGFDRGFLEQAAFDMGWEDGLGPHRYAWRCSQQRFEYAMDQHIIPRGSAGLDRLMELSGQVGKLGGPRIHEALADVDALARAWEWLEVKLNSTKVAMEQLYRESLHQRDLLELEIESLKKGREGREDG